MAGMLDPKELLEQATAARRAGRLSEALDLASQAVALSRASGQTGGADLPQALTRLAQALRDLRRPPGNGQRRPRACLQCRGTR